MNENIQNIYPLTGMQTGILYHYLKDKNSPVYNCTFSFTTHEMDIYKLQESMNQVMKKNEVLRGYFRWEDLSQPVFITCKEQKVSVQIHDLSMEDEIIRKRHNQELKKQLSESRFQLDKGPLIKIWAIILTEDEMEVLLGYHHILIDGWSFGILMKEWLCCFFDNKEPEEKVGYDAYHRLLQKYNSQAAINYWEEYLKDFRNQSGLPICCGPSDSLDDPYARSCIKLEKETKNLLYKQAVCQNVTAMTYFSLAWGLLLQKYNGLKDVVFGFVSSGRSLPMNDIEQMIGPFANTIPLRVNFPENMSVRDALIKLYGNILEQKEYENLPLHEIKACITPGKIQDLFNTLLVIENYPVDHILREYFNNSRLVKHEMYETNNYDMTISVSMDKDINIEFSYSKARYSNKTIESIKKHFMHILTQIVINTDLYIFEIELLELEERNKITNQFNDTFVEHKGDLSIINMIYEQAQQNSDMQAVICGDKTLTYKALIKSADEIGCELIQMGVLENEVVGIMLDLGVDIIASMVAVLRIGAAFLAVDKGYPVNRIRSVLDQVHMKVLITNKEWQCPIEGFDVNCLYIDDVGTVDLQLGLYKDVCYEKNIAYLISTSGSTGVPKCVAIKQESLFDFTIWAIKEFGYKTGYRSLLSNSFASDSAIQQIFPALASGGTLYLLNPETRKNPYKYINYLQENKINTIDELPSIINMLAFAIESSNLYQGKELFPDLCCVVLGSEYVPIESARYCRKYFNHTGEIINSYGPAECSVDATSYHYNGRNQNEVSLIGRPRQNSRVYIIDANKDLLPIGLTGEIAISGLGLAEGYYGRPDLTDERFIENPFEEGERLYLTGDLGRWHFDGNIEYMGRNDQQIQIRGHRVELSEVERQLYQIKELKNSAVVDTTDESGNTVLIAFLEKEKPITDYQIKQRLRQCLPEYMVPWKYVELDHLPCNDNGKIDRNELKSYKVKGKDLPSKNWTENEYSKKIMEIWKEVLGDNTIGVEDNFFEIGGDSIKVMELYIRLKNQFPEKEIEINDLFSCNTISQLSEFYQEKQTGTVECVNVRQEDESYETEDIAVIGIGLKLPGIDNLDDFWEVLIEGKNCIHILPESRKRLDLAYYKGKEYLQWGYIEEIDEFDSSFFHIAPRVADNMDPHQRVMLEVANLAIENAGYKREELKNSRTGVFVGAIMPTYYHHVNMNVDELLLTNLPSNLSGRIAYHLGLNGPAYLVDSACSSSFVALHNAILAIRNGDCDAALVGGTSIELELLDRNVALESGIVSKSERCNTFSSEADGTIGGEGSIAIMIKSLKRAKKDKDYIHGIIKGSGIVQDGFRSNGITAPSSEAQAECIQLAFKNSKITLDSISYFEVHGSATKLGDPIEIKGLHKALEERQDKQHLIPVGCVKSNLGHLDNVAGLAGLVKVLLCMKKKMLVPSINFERPNPYIDFHKSGFYVNTSAKNWIPVNGEKRRAGISSFGLSGTNTHVIVEEHDDSEYQDIENGFCEIATVSGEDEYVVRNQLKALSAWMKENKIYSLKDISFTLNCCRHHYKKRISFVADTKEQLLSLIDTVLMEEDEGLCNHKKYSVLFSEYVSSEKYHIEVGGFIENEFISKYGFKIEYPSSFEKCQMIMNLIGNLCILDCLRRAGIKFKNIVKSEYRDMLVEIIEGRQKVGDVLKQINNGTYIMRDSEARTLNEHQNIITINRRIHLENHDICLLDLKRNEKKAFLKLLSLLYNQDEDINFDFISKGRKVPITSSPYHKKTHWIKAYNTEESSIKANMINSSLLREKGIFHHLRWVESELNKTHKIHEPLSYMILSEGGSLAQELTLYLSAEQISVTNIFIKNRVTDILKNMTEPKFDCIVILLDFLKEQSDFFREDYTVLINDYIDKYIYGVRKLLKDIACINKQEISVFFVTNKLHDICEDDILIHPERNLLSAISKTINAEVPNMRSFVLDIGTFSTDSVKEMVVAIKQEFLFNDNYLEVAYRNGRRFIPQLTTIDSMQMDFTDKFRDGMVYIITGGTGGIALEICKRVAKRRNVTFVLLSRNGIGQEYLGDKRYVKKCKDIQILMEMGCQVDIIKVDVSDYQSLKEAMEKVKVKYGKISGIIHAAGIEGEKVEFLKSSKETFEKTFSSKIYGTLYMERIFRREKLDFFIVFSSLDTYMPSSGASSYTCANAFLDSFTTLQRQMGRPFSCINWGGWRKIGMGVKENQDKKEAIKGMKSISYLSPLKVGLDLEEGLLAFDEILASDFSNLIVTELNKNDVKTFRENKFFSVSEDIRTVELSIEKVNLSGITLEKIQMEIASIWEKTMGIENLAYDESYFTYGGNSIIGVEIIFKMMDAFGLELSVQLLFEQDTINKLAQYIYSLAQKAETTTTESIPKANPLN